MTSATGGSLLHSGHRFVIAVVLRLEKIRMALITTEHAAVNIMAEDNTADIFGLNSNISCVAGHAVPADTKGRASIVAGTTGYALFHSGHRGMVAVVLRLEKIRMTFITTEHVAMTRMAEDNAADTFSLNRDVSGMAGHAVAADAKSSITIMTSTT